VTHFNVFVNCTQEEWNATMQEYSRLDTADPRNPQPGQVWTRNGRTKTIIFVFDREVYQVISREGDAVNYDDWLAWRSWACPWWRRRKHWARCVRWE